MAEAFRAFIAVDVGPLPGVVSLLDGLRATDADLKLVDPENVHVTMKFLGNLDTDRVPDVVAAMRAAGEDASPFQARLEGVGSFGSRRSPRVVWVGIQDEGRLAAIAERLDAALSDAGITDRETRGFKAHVTLARSRSPRGSEAVAQFVVAHQHADAGTLRVEHLTLHRSHLTPSGPRYEVVERVPLHGGA